MALIVEDGTGKTDADTYADLEFADAYHVGVGNHRWSEAAPSEKEAALRSAANYMVGRYRHKWKGYRVKIDQRLDWPRHDVELEDTAQPGATGQVYQFTGLYPSNSVPEAVKIAQCEFALVALDGPLVQNLTQGKKSVKIGPLAIDYDTTSSQRVRYDTAAIHLEAFLKSMGAAVGLVRR